MRAQVVLSVLTLALATSCGSNLKPNALAGKWSATGAGTLQSIEFFPGKKAFESHGADEPEHETGKPDDGKHHHDHWSGTFEISGSTVKLHGKWTGAGKDMDATATLNDGKLEISYPDGKQTFSR